MRVFYDHQVTSLQDAGGVSRYFYELVRLLSQGQTAEAELILGFERSAMPFRYLGRPAKVTSLPAGGWKPGYPRYACNEAISAAMLPLRGQYDVYHATYQRALPYVRRRALVVTHHDSTPDRFPELFPDAATIHARLAKLYARADRILCISESSQRDLLEFYPVDEAKTEVIHQGFSPLPGDEGKDPEWLPVRKQFGDRPYLLYVGSRAAYKNFSGLLEALSGQEDDALWLLAMGGGAWTAEEQERIRAFGLRDRIGLVPRASDAQLAAAYRGASLFVYPSLYEGFGFPPLEAMHAGCPVLVSRTSALPEVCGDAAFYFDPVEAGDPARLIEQLMNDEMLRVSRQEAGYAQVARYSWEKTAAATFAAYRKALAGR